MNATTKMAERARVYVRERDEVLLSLDETRIRTWMTKQCVPMPDTTEAFWRGVHKCIANIETMPPKARRESRLWLETRGSTPDIFS